VKLGSLRQGGRDGTLIVVDRGLSRGVRVPGIATLQAALEDWPNTHAELASVYRLLNEGRDRGAFPLVPAALAAPFPRAYQFADGSAYLHHVELVRKARKAEMPPSFYTDPLMYQGMSDGFLGPRDAILAENEEWGIDFEAEVAVITDDVPMAVGARAAERHIRLVTLLNDVSLRNLIPAELGKGFGFFHSKPASAMAPVVVTPDELGPAWDGARLALPLLVTYNGKSFGRANAGLDMQFGFPELVAHAARTRALGAGTVIGGGTVSNRDPNAGSSCLAERRMIETIEQGAPGTPFMRFGDTVRIEMLDPAGHSIFGAIEQEVARYTPPK
jgi:fumarylacetoacetate (FAA) hydrolase